MSERLSERLAALLAELPQPEQNYQMSAVASLLEDNGFAVGDPSRKNPKAFSNDLFLGGSLSRLVESAIRTDYDPSGAESPEDMILTLLPSDGHLD